MDIKKLLSKAERNEINPHQFLLEVQKHAEGTRMTGLLKQPGLELYRARAWNKSEDPIHMTDLSYPPPELTRLGRANQKGKPVFYAAAGIHTAITETIKSDTKQMIISKWVNTSEMQLNVISGENDSEISKLYDSLFTSKQNWAYRYSSVIAEHLTHSTKHQIGLLYPSVASKKMAHNIMLKPEYVDSSMRLVIAKKIRIDIATDSEYKITTTANAKPDKDGSLNWQDGAGEVVLNQPGESYNFTYNGFAWECYNSKGEPIYLF